MEKRDFFIKKTKEHYSINWKRLGGFSFLTVNTLIEAIAVQLLADGKGIVHINFCGIYSSLKIDSQVLKQHYVLLEINGNYMILNVSESNAPLVEVDICWIGSETSCRGRCDNYATCNFIQMKSKVYPGKLYFENKLVE